MQQYTYESCCARDVYVPTLHFVLTHRLPQQRGLLHVADAVIVVSFSFSFRFCLL